MNNLDRISKKIQPRKDGKPYTEVDMSKAIDLQEALDKMYEDQASQERTLYFEKVPE